MGVYISMVFKISDRINFTMLQNDVVLEQVIASE
jgi:hypothetical protein